MNVVTVYSQAKCNFCTRAMAFLLARSIDFRVVKIDTNEEARAFIRAQGHDTVPQIYRDGKLAVDGGYTGLVALTEAEVRERLS